MKCRYKSSGKAEAHDPTLPHDGLPLRGNAWPQPTITLGLVENFPGCWGNIWALIFGFLFGTIYHESKCTGCDLNLNTADQLNKVANRRLNQRFVCFDQPLTYFIIQLNLNFWALILGQPLQILCLN